MKQSYSDMFCDFYVMHLGAYIERSDTFWSNYFKVIKDIRDPIVPTDLNRCTRTNNLRLWEVWAALNNARLEKHHRVLEYGAWPSFYCVYLSTLVEEVFVIDNFQFVNRSDGSIIAFLNKMLPDVWVSEINKYNKDNLHVFKGNIEHTNFEDKYFDRIVSYGVHEHVKDDLQGMKEIHRILKDDGLVSMTIDYHYYSWPYNEALQGRCYNRDTITSLIDDSGFIFNDVPDWSIQEPLKNKVNTLEHPDPCAMAISLKKR